MAATHVARVCGLDELAHWIASAGGRGADRYELWQKTRGTEQERVHVGAAAEPFDLADEILRLVEADRRVELGHVSFAVFAYRGEDKTPMERAFVAPTTRAAVAMPLALAGAGDVAGVQGGSPGAAIASVLSTMHQMARDVFGSLQRENEHQRRTNEAMLRTSTGSFETFAKGYERTFGDLQGRLEASIKEGVELRAKYQVLEHDKLELERTLEELTKINTRELAEAERAKRRDEAALQTLKMLLPAVVAHLTKRPLDLAAVLGPAHMAFLDSITDAQLSRILAACTEAQQVFLIEILKAHRAAKGKPAPAAAQDASGAASGFADARKASGAPSAASAAPTPEDAALEREFQRLAEIFLKHGDRFMAWMERQTTEGAAEPARGS